MQFDFIIPQFSTNKILKAGGSSGQENSENDVISGLFLKKFNQILAKNGIKTDSISEEDGKNDLGTLGSNWLKLTPTVSEASSLIENVKSDLIKDMNTSEGFEFLTKLKQYLMVSGHNDLKEISLGDDGLETIEKMLVKANFPRSKVADLIDTLQAESDDGNVLVSDLMDGLLSIDPEDLSANEPSTDIVDLYSTDNDNDSASNDENVSALMDISAIPFITAIMQSLDIPDEVTNSIITDSEVKGEGLSLDKLITDLQSLQKKSFLAGINFQNSSEVDSIKGMLEQLGLSVDKNTVGSAGNANKAGNTNKTDSGTINLNDFVSALEDLKKESISKTGTYQATADNGLTVSKQTTPRLSLDSGISIKQTLDNSKDDLIDILNKSKKNSSALMASLDDGVKPSSIVDNQTNILDRQTENLMQSVTDSDPSDSLVEKLIGGLQVNKLSMKTTDNNENKQSADVDTRYRTLKSSSRHQLLMNLSTDSRITSNSVENIDNASEQEDNLGDMESLLKKLMTTISNHSSNISSSDSIDDSYQSNTGESKLKDSFEILSETLRKKIINLSQVQEEQNAKNISDINALTQQNNRVNEIRDISSILLVDSNDDSSNNISSSDSIDDSYQSNTGGYKLKDSFEILSETLRKKIINLSQVQEEQNAKNTSDTLVEKAMSEGAKNVDKISGLINSISNSENLVSGKKNDLNSRSSSQHENDTESILSSVEKKQSINILDSNQSGRNFSDGGDTKENASGLIKEKTTSSILPAYVTNQVVKSITKAFSRGETEIRLQLRPAELGRIFMTIDTRGGILKVNVVTENQAAKDILAGHANDLKNSMAGSGINIESFDVEMGSDFSQSMANSGQQSNTGSDSGKNRGSGQHTSIAIGDVDGATISNFLKNEDGNLHFVA